MSGGPVGRAVWQLQSGAASLLLRGLGRLPTPLVPEALGWAALAQAWLEPAYVRRVARWMRRVAPDRPARRTVAFLRNRGRFLAMTAWPRLLDPDEFRARTVLEGREHLDAARARGGVILVGAHVGPGLARWVVMQAGYDLVTLAGGRRRFTGGPWSREARAIVAPQGGSGSGEAPAGADQTTKGARGRLSRVRLGGDDPLARAIALQRARRSLLDGAIVRVTVDGAFGDVLFALRVGGEGLVVRKGWWTLRRQTGAAALPVLTRETDGRVVVTVEPPLPPPVADEDADARACRAALEPLLVGYVTRYPEQCLGVFRAPASGPVERAPRGHRPGAPAAAPERAAGGPAGPDAIPWGAS